jgi:hypothetical protein
MNVGGWMRNFGVLVALLAAAGPAVAQEVEAGPLIADVVGIAGEDFYLSIGSDDGLRAGAELEVRSADEDRLLGRIRVRQVSSSRSLVAFSGDPFAVTRGARLSVRPVEPAPAGAAAAGRPVARPEQAGERRSAEPPSRTGIEAHGSFGVSFDARKSTTEWEDVGLDPVDRTFTTPATWLNLRATGLPAGFRLRLNARATHRGSSDDLIDPASLVRVNSAQLTNSFGVVDLGFGRTYNPYDVSAGTFDGLYLHAGRDLGAGVAAGFEPERATGDVSTDVPKLSAFADYTHRGAELGYRGVVSVTAIRPKEATGRVDRTYANLRQTLRVGRVRFGQSLQLERDPVASGWGLSRLLLDASAGLGGGLSLRGRYSHRRPADDFAVDEFQPYSRDLGTLGIGYARSGTYVGLDGGFHDSDVEASAGFMVTASAGHRSASGLGFDISAGYWHGDRASTLSVRPGLSHRFGPATARAWYALYRTDEPLALQLTHTVGASVSAPIADRVRVDLSGRMQRGSILRGSGLSASVSWLF